MGQWCILLTFIIMMCTSVLVVKATCTGEDCVKYDLSTEANCTEVPFEKPTYDCRWGAGLNLNVDQVILGGRIAAYRIEWFHVGWSDWYVPGFNDLNSKFNPGEVVFPSCSIQGKKMGMSRVWAYFFDHNHMYIVCKNQ